MITLSTNCNECIHSDTCKYKNNAEHAMNKLKKMNYGNGYNDDYPWEMMSDYLNIHIDFRCENFFNKNSSFFKTGVR